MEIILILIGVGVLVFIIFCFISVFVGVIDWIKEIFGSETKADEAQKLLAEYERQNQECLRQRAYNIYCTALVTVACCDGRNVREKLELVKKIVADLDFVKEIVADLDCQLTDSTIERIVNSGIDIKECGRDFLEVWPDSSLRVEMLRCMFSIASFDGLSPEEEQCIYDFSIGVELNYSVFESLKMEVDLQKENEQDNLMSVEEALSILGCSYSSSNEEIQTSYKNLVKLYHTDKLPKDSPDWIVKEATERFESLQIAYEIIRKKKGF